MIAGVGIDMVDSRRIADALARFGDRFIQRILVDAELRPGLEGDRLTAYLARQFAAKEAISKALGTGMRQGIHFRNLVVTRDTLGAPRVSLEDEAAQRAAAIGISQVHLSISDEAPYAIAYALAVKI